MKHKIAIKITLIYFTAGFLWILFSDKILEQMAGSSDVLSHFQTYKGWFFVSFTAFLLYLLIKSEISKKNKIETDLEQAKIKAEESDLLKSAFLSNMSHEIRTPLNGILGFSELLLDENFGEEDKRIFARHLSKNGQDLLKLINDIMDISRIQQNQFQLQSKKFNLNSLLDVIYLDYQHSEHRLNKNQIDFRLIKGAEDSDVEIYSDAVRFTHIFQRLLNNAFFYTNEGFIRFGYIVNEGAFEFFVEDSGTGIEEINQKMIFKPFFKGTKHIVGNKGFGLGLAISKGLVKLLGGELEFTSKPRLGSKFFFRINKLSLFDEPINPNKNQMLKFNGTEINSLENNLIQY
ncbi:MAG: HAMP domain-containing sensor histidine kinase [Prolixibacteraceae bacterium]